MEGQADRFEKLSQVNRRADQIRKRRLQNDRLFASRSHRAESPELRQGLAKQRFSLGKGSSPTPREPGSGALPLA